MIYKNTKSSIQSIPMQCLNQSILLTYSVKKMIDIAFISNESNSLHIDDTHPIHTKIAQHLQLEALYDDHFKEYHQRKFQIENNAMFVDTMDSEELKSLKQSKTLYHDSVIKHTLDIANVIERDKELKTIIHSAIHNTE
eukprot:777552_1